MSRSRVCAPSADVAGAVALQVFREESGCVETVIAFSNSSTQFHSGFRFDGTCG